MLCKASDLARYILKYFSDKNKPVSNRQLQNLLYFCWICYYKTTQEELFDEPFVAWSLGPTIVSVYREYCSYAARPIFKSKGEFPKNSNADKTIIDSCLDQYQGWTAFQMLNRQNKGNAWDTAFALGGKNTPISFELMKSLGK